MEDLYLAISMLVVGAIAGLLVVGTVALELDRLLGRESWWPLRIAHSISAMWVGVPALACVATILVRIGAGILGRADW